MFVESGKRMSKTNTSIIVHVRGSWKIKKKPCYPNEENNTILMILHVIEHKLFFVDNIIGIHSCFNEFHHLIYIHKITIEVYKKTILN